MLANFLIGIREGLEAAIIVGILVSFAVRMNRPDVVRRIWWGVSSAILVSLATGAAIFFALSEASDSVQPIITGALSIVAAALLTWMIFWMARTSKALRGQLEGSLAARMAGGGVAVAFLAFTAVVREGVETAIFVWASVTASGSGLLDIAMAFLGIAVAVVLGWLAYKGFTRINLASFFLWTSAALIVVAAGLFAYGAHEFQEVGWLPTGDPLWDLTPWLGNDTIIGSFLSGLIAFRAAPTLVEVVVWVLYFVPAATAFVAMRRASRVQSRAKEPVNA